MADADIGLIGLAVMGANLARNIAKNNFKITVFNRTTETMEKFIEQFGGPNLAGEKNLEDFVKSLKKPRKIIIMVQAGSPVDKVIEQLVPLLDQEDIIIDCGNSNFRDTIRRTIELEKQQLEFFGCGVSGGEEGALNGPSMMPGGSKKVYETLKPVFEAIAARDFSGGPCVSYIGENGAGHYVKMVHNGIEYGVMQMMAEAYDLLRKIHNLSAPEIAEIFQNYNAGEKLQSFLFEISIPVLKKRDDFNHGHLLDHILDSAGQKGTGRWTAVDALERGIALSTITEAVYARIMSSHKEKRLQLAELFEGKIKKVKDQADLKKFIRKLENALYAGMLSSYAQGMELIRLAAKEQNWHINLAEVARIWEGGCIIRAKILGKLHKAYTESSQEKHLFEIPGITEELIDVLPDFRAIVAEASLAGIPVPSLGGSLAYFESMTSKNLPANFIQGLRDYFGAHTYQRTDREGNFHANWLQ